MAASARKTCACVSRGMGEMTPPSKVARIEKDDGEARVLARDAVGEKRGAPVGGPVLDLIDVLAHGWIEERHRRGDAAQEHERRERRELAACFSSVEAAAVMETKNSD